MRQEFLRMRSTNSHLKDCVRVLHQNNEKMRREALDQQMEAREAKMKGDACSVVQEVMSHALAKIVAEKDQEATMKESMLSQTKFVAAMDPLHRQVILDCYDDISRDMDPVQALRYSTVHWRDGDPGFIRAKARTEGPHCGARALLDKLLDVTKWSMKRLGAVSMLLTTLMICAWIVTVYYTDGMNDTPFMVFFPRRMKTFVGREDVFGKIDACLEQNRTCLIRGLGGVGKTSLAIEYGHRRAERYPGGVFWVSAAMLGMSDVTASDRAVQEHLFPPGSTGSTAHGEESGQPPPKHGQFRPAD
uniref:NB-ARC domain-containing protein n=1 Tax=Branchiostoma floridae TaxID=7739 RepID=C3ZHS8_BRAFL|eukprot:XP_002591861.1 hypothetical protein BRAFLDRAFT_89374 [Branchiostoma floridae]